MQLSNRLWSRAFLLLIGILSFASVANAGVCDSIGVERKNDKLFILHRIESNETLYSVSRKYKVSVDDLKKYNPEAAQSIKLGQVIKVPAPLPVTTAATTATTSSESVKTHKIQAGESLYSIAKKYSVSITEIKDANPGMTNSVQVGQTINIPVKADGKATATKPVQTTTITTTSPVTKETVEHKVASGETLYSIAKQYNVSVEDIKKANPGIGALKIGQVVKVPAAVVTTQQQTTVVTKPVTATTTTKPAASVEADTVQLQQDKVRLETMQTPPAKSIPASDFKKITESGFADLMPDNQDTPKYLAYHKTAPVGTIIQLLNESNGVKIYVRVVGKLTDTGTDGKTIIRISKKAYERIGGTGARVATTLMYIP
ncbi:MAG: LysM peptidoglycan-binding domain-containing protein [Cytophagales bacterium]|nr:LysM peptidoglycan-binding domain-containing protein [Cytophaga sp.]